MQAMGPVAVSIEVVVPVVVPVGLVAALIDRVPAPIALVVASIRPAEREQQPSDQRSSFRFRLQASDGL